MPSVSISPTPSEEAMHKRNYFFFLSVMVALAGFCQMFFLLNIMNGFFTCCVAGMGFYVIRDNTIDMQCMISWGMFSCMQGVLDTVMLIDRTVKMPPGTHMFSMEQPFLQNVVMFIILAGPMCQLATAYFVYGIYKSQQGYETAPQGSTMDRLYGAMPNMSRQSSTSTAAGGQQGFKPFQGTGNVLGAANV